MRLIAWCLTLALVVVAVTARDRGFPLTRVGIGGAPSRYLELALESWQLLLEMAHDDWVDRSLLSLDPELAWNATTRAWLRMCVDLPRVTTGKVDLQMSTRTTADHDTACQGANVVHFELPTASNGTVSATMRQTCETPTYRLYRLESVGRSAEGTPPPVARAFGN